MSVWDVIETLLEVHNRAGVLIEIRDTVDLLDRASRYTPRSSDDWDLRELRDDRMRRINRALQTHRDRTARMGREGTGVPNESAPLSDLFGAWADAHARNGAEGRQTVAARQAFEGCLMEWLNALTRTNTRVRDAQPRIERQRDFYQREKDLFSTLQHLAEQYVRYWPESAGQAQALAYMLDFERAAGLCQTILRNYDGGLSVLGRVESEVRAASAEANTWVRWYTNRSSAERDVAARREPRGT